MDPWGSAQSEASRAESHINTTSDLQFEDKFVEIVSKNRDSEINFERLPDSAEYLRSLETKLSKLTGARQRTQRKVVEQTLVQDLARAREDALVNFVTSSDNRNVEEDCDLERSITVNPLARRLVPEQALTTGEQVVLTKADQLEKEVEKEEESGQ